jgi:dihydroorotate dehydrogenase (fumarate)
VKGAVNIPVAVKLSPFYTNPLQFISALDNAGADAIVIFNRLLQPDVDIYNERHTFPYNLSSSEDLRLPLRFTGILYGNINASVCSTTGIYSGGDVIKMILAGADAVQVVSVMYRHGIDALRSMTEEIEKWMDAKGYADTDSFRGKLSLKDTRLKRTYQRAQYLDFMMNAGDILKKYRIIP